MTTNLPIRKIVHGIAEQVSGNYLYDILHKFRTVGFNAFSFLCGTDAFIGDRFPAKFVFADAWLYIAEHSVGRELDEKHTAFIYETDTADFCGGSLFDRCFTAVSTSYQNAVIMGLASLHELTSGCNSSSVSLISNALMDFNAFTGPPYPRASSAIFPFCLR